MSDVEREPCPRCGEPAALAAQICPHCKESVLVDLFVDSRIVDPRRRYEIARFVVTSKLPGATLASAQSALGLPGMPIARGLTRAEARAAEEALAAQGFAVHADSPRQSARPYFHAPQPKPRSSAWLKLSVTAAVTALAVFAAVRIWNEIDKATSPPTASAPVSNSAAPSPLTTQLIAEKATPSTVSLRCSDSIGTGFFVSDELLLTNAHVACSGSLIQTVFPNGRRLVAQVVKKDDWLDLALFRVLGAKATPLPLGDASRLRPGDKVVLIGSPRGLDFTVHEGKVSKSARNHLGIAYVQIDANVNPGNSGGPLLDSQGKVVGIVSMMVGKASGLGLALPVNYAYQGGTPLVGAPNPPPDQQKWNAILTKVAEEDKQEVSELANAFGVPPGGLIGAFLDAHGVPTAVVAQRGSGLIGSASHAFFGVEQDGRTLCRRSYSVDRWRRIEDWIAERTKGKGESRFAQWMLKNEITRNLYVGFANLDWLRSDCSGVDWRKKADLHLEDGDRHADRLTISGDDDTED